MTEAGPVTACRRSAVRDPLLPLSQLRRTSQPHRTTAVPLSTAYSTPSGARALHQLTLSSIPTNGCASKKGGTSAPGTSAHGFGIATVRADRHNTHADSLIWPRHAAGTSSINRDSNSSAHASVGIARPAGVDVLRDGGGAGISHQPPFFSAYLVHLNLSLGWVSITLAPRRNHNWAIRGV
jgi:hypothetical protein